jgi:protoporphyrinogen oxidase
MKIAVIGAGPAGLTAAYLLAKEGYEPVVYEATDRVGGMSKTIDVWGYKADLGPHRFFSSNKRVNSLWLEVVGSDYQMIERLTRIYYNNVFFHYPLKPFDALSKLGFWEASKCIISFISEKITPTASRDDFESWVTNRFGKRLFELFFKSYSEKLWGINCDELDADFAAQRIKKLSLYEAIRNSLFQDKEVVHKTLLDQFAYPKGGTGVVYERMRESIESNNGSVLLNTPIVKVLKNNTSIYGLQLQDGTIKKYDKIISTMPLSLLLSTMEDVPEPIRKRAKKLQFRNTVLVYLEIEGTHLFKDNWIYIHSNELKTGRITNFRNWGPDLYAGKENTLLALEYWCDFTDDFWSAPNSDIIDLAKIEIRKTNLIANRPILNAKVVRIPRCYPVYRKGYKDDLHPIENYLENNIKDLFIIGRYGAFKYNNQDHSILMGILAAENITHEKNNALWEVNTDYETYIEQTIITETGLKVY